MQENSKIPIRISIIFLIVSALWIIFSDLIVFGITKNSNSITDIQTYKGLFYILSATIFIFFLVKRNFRQISRKALENELANEHIKELNKRLEEKVAKRTEMLNRAYTNLEERNADLIELNQRVADDKSSLINLNEELKKYSQELKDSSITKDKFISIIAHDLKNPIQALILNTELLIRNIDSGNLENSRKKANQIDMSIQRLWNLIENLLLWARTQNSTIDYHPEKLNLRDVCSEINESIKNEAERKNIELISSGNESYEIMADKKLLSIILRNLHDNAVKYTRSGGYVKRYCKDRGSHIEIFVEDNGIGMDEDEINGLFKIDVHQIMTGTDNEKGTGLGLLITKEFVKLHGGVIKVQSELDHGSLFSFTIPKAKN